MEKRHPFPVGCAAVPENVGFSNVQPATGLGSRRVGAALQQMACVRRVADLALVRFPVRSVRGPECGARLSAQLAMEEDFRVAGPVKERGGRGSDACKGD